MSTSIPIIELYGNLIVSIQVELSDRLVLDLKRDIAREIQSRPVTGLIIEVSGVDILDTFIARSVQEMVQIAKLMGVRAVLAGLDPAMAITLVEMGMVLVEVETALDLEHAIEVLSGRPQVHGRAMETDRMEGGPLPGGGALQA